MTNCSSGDLLNALFCVRARLRSTVASSAGLRTAASRAGIILPRKVLALPLKTSYAIHAIF